VGVAGASARVNYERRHARREQKIDQRWGKFSGVVKLLTDDPQSTRAWAKGSEGERRLAALLERTLAETAVLLHDRKVPGTRGNIDHIAIAASGIWVIDTKKYEGLVERRDKGGWSKTDYRLFVGGRDRTKLVEGMNWQIDAARAALVEPDISISAAVCFVEAEWKFFAKPFILGGVWVTGPNKLAEMIAGSGPLTLVEVNRVAERLAVALPPAFSER
jgi:hypothetical protein